MQKLPVFETASRVYQFLFRDAATILRLSWLPLLLMTIVQYFAMRAHFAGMEAMLKSGNFMTMISPLWQWQVANVIATILCSAVVAVSLHRVILLGDRKPGRFAHLAFGKVELLFALLPIILMVPTAVITLLIVGLSYAFIPKQANPIFFVMLVLWCAAVLFVLIRLQLVFPITVLESRYKFSQSWSLTRGNVWRLVGLWILALLPMWIVVLVVSTVTPSLFGFEAGTPKDVMRAFEQIQSFLLIQSIFGFVWSIVGGALSVAVLSYSFKALSGRHPDDVWVPES